MKTQLYLYHITFIYWCFTHSVVASTSCKYSHRVHIQRIIFFQLWSIRMDLMWFRNEQYPRTSTTGVCLTCIYWNNFRCWDFRLNHYLIPFFCSKSVRSKQSKCAQIYRPAEVSWRMKLSTAEEISALQKRSWNTVIF